MAPPRFYHSISLIALSFLVATSAAAQSPFARPGELPKIRESTQRAILDSVATVLDTAYVMVDEGRLMIDHLNARWAAGDWRELTDPVEFVQKIHEELHGIYDDGHLDLAAMRPVDPSAENAPQDPREAEEFKERLRQRNYGFRKAEILAGNIGYLKLDQFVDTDLAGDTGVAAMNFLANCDALVIDLRENGGGSASMIQLLAGYLLGEQEHLIDWYIRDLEFTKQSYSQAYVPGRRMPDTPLYVLTSRSTGSAAEEFTFDMKHLERGTIVGDTTAGAGNTVASYFFQFDGFRVGMRASYGAATDPRTGEGWEGLGVIPDIAVPAGEALTYAKRDILLKRREGATDPQTLAAVEWALADLEAELNPVSLTAEEMDAFTGTYGPRRIYVEGGTLFYQREGRGPNPLQPMGQDLFRVGDLGFFRIRFARDAGGTVDRLIGIYDDGREDENERTGAP